jgi:alpha-methylacyl-CoA racemase
MLADLGADVIPVDRATPGQDVLGVAGDPLMRGRRSIGVDTKKPEGVACFERMGLGPDQVIGRAGERPVKLLADFAASGMLLAMGLLAALTSAPPRGRARWWTRPWSTARRC